MNQVQPRSDPHDVVVAEMERAVQLVQSGESDPEFVRRIHAEAKKIRDEILANHGVLDIAVDLIRETRDEG